MFEFVNHNLRNNVTLIGNDMSRTIYFIFYMKKFAILQCYIWFTFFDIERGCILRNKTSPTHTGPTVTCRYTIPSFTMHLFLILYHNNHAWFLWCIRYPRISTYLLLRCLLRIIFNGHYVRKLEFNVCQRMLARFSPDVLWLVTNVLQKEDLQENV